MFEAALAFDGRQRKPRLDQSRVAEGWLRAYQGHSEDSGHPIAYVNQGLSEAAVSGLIATHGPSMWHGTDVHCWEGILQDGLVPGGGPGGRLAVHYVLGPCPRQWEDGRRGFRRGSTAVVEVELAVIRDAGVSIYCGADGVGLTGQIRPTGISRIWALPQGSGQYSLKVAELNVSRDRLVRLMRLKNSPAGQPAAASSSDTPVPKAKAEAPAGHATAVGSRQKPKDGAGRPLVYPRRNLPKPNALDQQDSEAEEEAEREQPAAAEESSASSELLDTRAPSAAKRPPGANRPTHPWLPWRMQRTSVRCKSSTAPISGPPFFPFSPFFPPPIAAQGPADSLGLRWARKARLTLGRPGHDPLRGVGVK